MTSTTTASATGYLTFSQIKATYPNQWVYIGNPVLTDADLQTSLVNKLAGGVVLWHGSDKREIIGKARQLRQGFKKTACVFTGQLPRYKHILL